MLSTTTHDIIDLKVTLIKERGRKSELKIYSAGRSFSKWCCCMLSSVFVSLVSAVDEQRIVFTSFFNTCMHHRRPFWWPCTWRTLWSQPCRPGSRSSQRGSQTADRADINAHNVKEIGNKDHHQESIDQIGELRRKMKKVPLLILPLPWAPSIVPTCFAKDAARAVFPALGAPSRRTLTCGGRLRCWWFHIRMILRALF